MRTRPPSLISISREREQAQFNGEDKWQKCIRIIKILCRISDLKDSRKITESIQCIILHYIIFFGRFYLTTELPHNLQRCQWWVVRGQYNRAHDTIVSQGRGILLRHTLALRHSQPVIVINRKLRYKHLGQSQRVTFIQFYQPLIIRSTDRNTGRSYNVLSFSLLLTFSILERKGYYCVTESVTSKLCLIKL